MPGAATSALSSSKHGIANIQQSNKSRGNGQATYLGGTGTRKSQQQQMVSATGTHTADRRTEVATGAPVPPHTSFVVPQGLSPPRGGEETGPNHRDQQWPKKKLEQGSTAPADEVRVKNAGAMRATGRVGKSAASTVIQMRANSKGGSKSPLVSTHHQVRKSSNP